jgi:imidazolonepropionase-like amidohydrolase
MNFGRTAFAVLASTSFATVGAQQQPTRTTPIVVRAARMLDVESGRIVANARVVVDGERISAINPASLPAGARVIDIGDVTLLPGFIDTHTHLGGEIGPNMLLTPVQETEVDAAFKAARNGRTTLMAGFTTVRDFGGSVTVAVEREDERARTEHR